MMPTIRLDENQNEYICMCKDEWDLYRQIAIDAERLTQAIMGVTPDTPVKGEIESKAFELGHLVLQRQQFRDVYKED